MSFLYAAFVPLLGMGYLIYAYRRKKQFLETPIPLKLREWRRYGERFTTLTLERAAGNEPLPEWSAGSHIVVDVDAPKGKYRRAYSLLSADDHSWEIAVAGQPHGKVSGHLLEKLDKGRIIHAQPPRGRFFKLEASPHHQVCLVGGGVGIAPLIAMANEALSQGRIVHLLHAGRNAQELIKQDELTQLGHENPRFHYTPVLSRERNPGTPYAHGRIDQAMLQRLGFAQFEGDVYLCGSSQFVSDLAAHFKQLGCHGTIREESFGGNAEHLPFTVTVGDKRFTQGHAPTLLAACEENGALQFAECRTGHCLNCRATLKSGQVTWIAQCKNTPSLPPGQILTCACVPASNVELELHS